MTTDKTRETSDAGIGWSASYGKAIIKLHLADWLERTPATSESTPADNSLVQVGWVF